MDETIPGSYHEFSEPKVAPMLVTGSAVGWLLEAFDTYLEAGRLSKRTMSPYLSDNEGPEAVYRYAEAYDEFVTSESALVLNRLCFSDPHFIAHVMRGDIPNRDLTTPDGVVRVVDYEIGYENVEFVPRPPEIWEIQKYLSHLESQMRYLNSHLLHATTCRGPVPLLVVLWCSRLAIRNIHTGLLN